MERNPVRAQLVARAEEWLWSSARFWHEPENRPSGLSVGPVPRPEPWLDWVIQPLTIAEREASVCSRARPLAARAG